MRLVFVLLFIGALGCNSDVKRKNAPVNVSGKVLHSGQPIGGVVMVFQPLGDGHVREFPTGADGSFQGEIISGEYAYYVGRAAMPAAMQALKKLAPQYLQADLARTVNVEAGSQLALSLD